MISSIHMMAETERPVLMVESANHFAVITQKHGSIFGKVLPYCIANTMLMLVVIWCNNSKGIDFSVSDRGHVFLSLMVSYLIVTRSRIALDRYMLARRLIGNTIRIFRELVQHANEFSRFQKDKNAAKWRIDMAEGTCNLLRAVVILLETKTTRKDNVEEIIEDTEQAEIKEHQKSPLLLILHIRKIIESSNRDLTKPLSISEEMFLLSLTSDFLTAYHGLTKLLSTPCPFPLVQMTRTVLLVWVFTLPLILMGDVEKLIPRILINFFCTYGFIGLELITIEIEDPFGTGPNSFPVNALVEVAISDIALMIRDVDGPRAITSLRKHLNKNIEFRLEKEALDRARHTEDMVNKMKLFVKKNSPRKDSKSSLKEPKSVSQTTGSQSKNEIDYGTREIDPNFLLDCESGGQATHLRPNVSIGYGTLTADFNVSLDCVSETTGYQSIEETDYGNLAVISTASSEYKSVDEFDKCSYFTEKVKQPGNSSDSSRFSVTSFADSNSHSDVDCGLSYESESPLDEENSQVITQPNDQRNLTGDVS